MNKGRLMNNRVLFSLIAVLFFLNFDLQGQIQNLKLSMECGTALPGRTLCLKVKAYKINQLNSLSFTIGFDPKVLELLDTIPGSCFSKLGVGLNTAIPGRFAFLWSDPGLKTIDIIDSCDVVSLCFKFIGKPGEKSRLNFNSSVIDLDAGVEFGSAVVSTNMCDSEVLPDKAEIISGFCNPSVKGGNDGIIRFYGVYAPGPYTYELRDSSNAIVRSGNNVNPNQEVILNGLTESRYRIILYDKDGVIFPSSTIALIDGGNIPKFDLVKSNPSCFNRPDGVIRIKNVDSKFAINGIEWSTGVFNEDSLEALSQGIYTATLLDQNGCKVSKTDTLKIDTLKFTVTVLDSATCNGKKDSRVRVSMSGGTPKYSIAVGTFSTFSEISGSAIVLPFTFAGGLNKLRVRDMALNYANNVFPCEIEEYINIPKKYETKSSIEVVDVACKGETGSVLITMQGPGDRYTFPTQYDVTNLRNMNPSGLASVASYKNDLLKAGDYYVIAQSTSPAPDFAGCRDTIRFSIKEAITPLRITPAVVQPSCTQLGSIRFAIQGGQPPYKYSWNDGDTLRDKTNLTAGTYKVTVSDFYKCDSIFSFELKSSDGNVAKASVVKSISCKNAMDGELTVDVFDGVYDWQDETGKTWNTKTISNLSSGLYSVTVTKNGCITKDTIRLVNPSGINFTNVEVIAPECPNGGIKGSVGIIIDGGNGPFMYEWTNITNPTNVLGRQSVLPSIGAGSFNVKVTDDRGCKRDTTISVKAPDPILVNILSVQGVVCNGDSNGNVFVKALGGKIPNNNKFRFFWSNGQQTPVPGLFDMDVNKSLKAGRNWLLVGDGQCLSDSVYIDVPDAAPINIDKTTQNLCSDLCNGKAKITSSGGTGTLRYNWSGVNSTLDSVSNLCIGKYFVTVTDDLACRKIDSFSIIKSDSISVAFDSVGSVSPSCRVPLGRLVVNASGGSPNYTYQWSGTSSINNTADKLDVGTYSVTVTDQKGCSNTLSRTLTKPSPIVADIIEPLPPQCAGKGSCIKFNSIVGGSGNKYTMQINNGLRIPVDSCFELIPSTYKINVFDQDGCNSEYSVTIPSIEKLQMDLGDNIKINLGDSITRIEPIITGPNPIVKYQWTGTGSLSFVDTLKSALTGKPNNNLFISLIVTDQNGCTSVDNILVEISNSRNVYIPNIMKFSAQNDMDNTKFLIATGFGVELVENMSIYNRWGNKVFERQNFMPDKDDKSTYWDGNFNGQPLTPDVYVYTITVRFIDGERKVYKGDITLLK